MYIVYNLTKQSEMTLFHKINPSLTSDNFYGLIWSEITLNFNPWQNYESKHMYILDQLARFDPYWTGMTQVWPLMTLIDLEKYEIWIVEKILSRNKRILDTYN